MRIQVNPARCPQDHHCPSIAVCPKGAITQKSISSLPEVDPDKCIGCASALDTVRKAHSKKCKEIGIIRTLTIPNHAA